MLNYRCPACYLRAIRRWLVSMMSLLWTVLLGKLYPFYHILSLLSVMVRFSCRGLMSPTENSSITASCQLSTVLLWTMISFYSLFSFFFFSNPCLAISRLMLWFLFSLFLLPLPRHIFFYFSFFHPSVLLTFFSPQFLPISPSYSLISNQCNNATF